MKSVNNLWTIPNLFTVSNMLCGSLSILASFQGELTLAGILILTGALFDFFDGFLARILKQPSELGKQLDSLADMITFGLAPGMMLFAFLSFLNSSSASIDLISVLKIKLAVQDSLDALFNNVEVKNAWIPYVSFLVPVFSMLRLAKFNLDTRQTESFIGLPTPANALFFISLVLHSVHNGFLFNAMAFPLLWLILIFVFSCLLLAELPLFALKFKDFGWKGNEYKYSLLLISLIIIPLLKYASIALIVFLYLIFSAISNYSKKSKKNEV